MTSAVTNATDRLVNPTMEGNETVESLPLNGAEVVNGATPATDAGVGSLATCPDEASLEDVAMAIDQALIALDGGQYISVF